MSPAPSAPPGHAPAPRPPEARARPRFRTFALERTQDLASPLEALFPFFADAHNLEELTPPWLAFRILTPAPIVMRPGVLIDYRLRLHGVPLRWRTEITAWEPPVRFVDEQLRGPYRLWVHEHTFAPIPGGTRCLDRVTYAPPGGPLAGVIDALFVRRELRRIFDHRAQVMARRFGALG